MVYRNTMWNEVHYALHVIQLYIYIYIYTHIYRERYNMCIYIYIYIQYTYMHILMYIYIYIYISALRATPLDSRSLILVPMHVQAVSSASGKYKV